MNRGVAPGWTEALIEKNGVNLRRLNISPQKIETGGQRLHCR
jgi:hypothetical protein